MFRKPNIPLGYKSFSCFAENNTLGTGRLTFLYMYLDTMDSSTTVNQDKL